MKLYVMRHGPAQDDSPSGRDADRALTPSGRERVAAVAKSMLAEGEAPFSILSSPLVRAVETAEVVAEVTHLSRRARELGRLHNDLHRDARIRQGNVVANATVEQEVLLEDNANLASQPRRLDHREIDAVDQHAPGYREIEPLNQLG